MRFNICRTELKGKMDTVKETVGKSCCLVLAILRNAVVTS